MEASTSHRVPERVTRAFNNILPLHEYMFAGDDGALSSFPEVQAAMQTLRRCLNDYPELPPAEIPTMDVMDWLGAFFGFQEDNVRNQREHIVLLLANHQMRAELSSGESVPEIDPAVVRRLRKKLLQNYESWCSFVGRKKSLRNVKSNAELMHCCLYLLIWGEAANLRFMPECLCYIFDNMAMELKKIIDQPTNSVGDADTKLSEELLPFSYGKNQFLEKVVTPIYDAVRREAEASQNGRAPHKAWGNYDDMNEYFWSRKRSFDQLSWRPLKMQCDYLKVPSDGINRERPQNKAEKLMKFLVGNLRNGKKTGFVEQRSFWTIFRSFDRVWTMHILMLQVMMIVAFNGDGLPWIVVRDRDVQASLLTVFITWAGLRVLQAILDATMQFSLISKHTWLLAVRMALKIGVALAWTGAFSLLLARIWSQRTRDRRWSPEADRRFVQFLVAAGLFILPDLLYTALTFVPWIVNSIERSDSMLIHTLTWWFHTPIFVGRGLRQGLNDTVKYTLFWLVIVIFKFSFSFFLQVKPFVKPTRRLLGLGVINAEWHQFFSNRNRFVVALLWAPVVLVYLMDMQIWYSVFSCIVGAFVGLLSHLGEIRYMHQLKLRFPAVANAAIFNLIAAERRGRGAGDGSWRSKCRDKVTLLKLRYGLCVDYKKIEPNSSEALKFANIWNEIISSFREEDLVSDHEVELLTIPGPGWNISVVQWPCFLVSNEVQLAMRYAIQKKRPKDKRLWRKICRSEYRRCAVVECYDTLKHLLKRITKEGSLDHEVVQKVFELLDADLLHARFTQKHTIAEALEEIRDRVLELVEALLKKPADQNRLAVQHAVQNLYEVVTKDLPIPVDHKSQTRYSDPSTLWELRQEYNEQAGEREKGYNLFTNAVVLPDPEDEAFFLRLRRLRTILRTKESTVNVPQNLEARRRIAFFSNSVFMTMPRAPSMKSMRAFSVLTPYYNEDVLYSRDKLLTPNEDGVTVLFYLQSIYPGEWKNFLERIKVPDDKESVKVILEDEKKAHELKMWASFRGQTLGRTVRGMMYYHRAVKKLAHLDVWLTSDTQEQQETRTSIQLQNLYASPRSSDYSAARHSPSNMSGTSLLLDNATTSLKFTYVVSCQNYHAQKMEEQENDKAEDILLLMKTYPALRVAYVHEEQSPDKTKYYSVLLKYDSSIGSVVEIYRIQLPGPFKLGEGKPENQNHALIFTRGDALQAIDMNQDNYFEEALKLRNLLEEFGQKYGLRRPKLLGVREHVFTGSVSSLSWFMSAQETSFVTLGQRVLANPLKIRMHYGHPDVFDRLWFLSRGGISKGSKAINVSDDIFAGFNCILRGGNITHHEYIEVGKGRDVGFNQIARFESKAAGGNGEQMLSREVYRLGHRLDFFRMLSFYYTTVGFYVSNMLIILTFYTFLWGRVYLALSGIEKAIKDGLSNVALTASLNQQFAVQIGVFSALPILVESSLDRGFTTAIWEYLIMQLQLCSVFFNFSLGTKGISFGRTIFHGGVGYWPTGREFVIRHEKFADIYRLYARSHYVKGIELIILLIIYESYGGIAKNTTVYILMTLSTWFLALSWIMAPFLFNPSGFDWLLTVNDYEDFQSWLWFKRGALSTAEQGWEMWWNDVQDHLRTTGVWGKALEVALSLRFFLIQYGMVYRLKIAAQNKSILVYLLSWIYIVIAIVVYIVVARAGETYSASKHIYYRAIQCFVAIFITVVLVILVELTDFQFKDLFLSLLAFVPTGWGLLCMAMVLKPLLKDTKVWSVVVEIARLYELGIAIVVWIPLAILSWLPGFQAMQTRILFNQAFSRGLQISQFLAAKQPHRGGY